MILPLYRQIGYASGNFGKSLLWTSLEYLFLFYLTDIVGISPEVAGLMILLSLIWDGVINPFIGYWIDRRSTMKLDYRPFLRLAPPLAGLLFVAVFLVPFDQSGANLAYLFVALFLFRTAYALLDVPHNALLAQMPVASTVRTRLAAMRFFFSSLGGLLIAVIAAPVFAVRIRPEAHEQVVGMAMIAGTVITLTVWQSLVPARQAFIERSHVGPPLDPRRYLVNILHNRIAVLYLCLAAVFAATAPLLGKTLPFLLRYVRNEGALLPTMLVAMTIGQMIAMPVCTLLAKHYGRFAVGYASLAGLTLALGSLHLALGASPSVLAVIVGCWGFCNGGTILTIWAMAGDIADHIASTNGDRTDAGLLAFLTMVQKCAIGLAAMMAGLSLHWGGFVAGIEQAEPARDAIRFAALAIPALGAAGAAMLLRQLQRRLA